MTAEPASQRQAAEGGRGGGESKGQGEAKGEVRMADDYDHSRRVVHLGMNRLVFLVVVLGIGQGCGAKSTIEEASVVFYQVRFYLPWKVDPEQMVASRPRPPAVGFTLRNGDRILEYLNWRLKLNGKDYGTVKAGDSVKVTEDGKVFVNEEERQPEGKAPG